MVVDIVFVVVDAFDVGILDDVVIVVDEVVDDIVQLVIADDVGAVIVVELVPCVLGDVIFEVFVVSDVDEVALDDVDVAVVEEMTEIDMNLEDWNLF